MSSLAAPKFLPERLICTKQEIRALDPLTQKFVVALAVAGDVIIEEEGRNPRGDGQPRGVGLTSPAARPRGDV